MTLKSATVGTSAELVTRANCAGFWLRLVAATIDAFLAPILAILAVLILLIPLAVAGIVTQNVHGHLPETVYNSYALGLALFVCLSELIYFAVFESSPLQATPGKLTLGLIVTDSEGRRLTFWRALARNFLKVVSQFTLYIGYILAGLTDRKQALHDMMSGCLVVRKLP
ncbi:MAG: RDD family protein [Candidatus Obscuribacterales bacterium]|nr:RDD family protein [Candidatus Obscuribacterales bacterium]